MESSGTMELSGQAVIEAIEALEKRVSELKACICSKSTRKQ